jgi:uncharacterized protein YdaU (DUF1376 family)
MHYYTHNINDYLADTTHLSLLEHGVYRRLLDLYYQQEQAICKDHANVMRKLCVRTADEMQAFENVLNDFFTATDDGYIHTRCEKEIAAYHEKAEKAKKSAKARWGNAPSDTNAKPKQCDNDAIVIDADANAMRTHTEHNANGMLTNNHKPITNNQEPITNNQEPIYSVTNVTGEKSPVMKSDEFIFSVGVSILVEAGNSQQQARAFLGKLRKSHDDDLIVTKLKQLADDPVVHPAAWLTKALPIKTEVKKQANKGDVNSKFAADLNNPSNFEPATGTVDLSDLYI